MVVAGRERDKARILAQNTICALVVLKKEKIRAYILKAEVVAVFVVNADLPGILRFFANPPAAHEPAAVVGHDVVPDDGEIVASRAAGSTAGGIARPDYDSAAPIVDDRIVGDRSVGGGMPKVNSPAAIVGDNV